MRLLRFAFSAIHRGLLCDNQDYAGKYAELGKKLKETTIARCRAAGRIILSIKNILMKILWS